MKNLYTFFKKFWNKTATSPKSFSISKKLIRPKWNINTKLTMAKEYQRPGGIQDEAIKEYRSKVKTQKFKFKYLKCIHCKNNQYTEISQIDRYLNYCPIVICQKCGLIQTQPMQTPESLSLFYSDIYTRMYRGKIFATSNFDSPSPLREKFIQRLKKSGVIEMLPPNPTIIEAGCGNGGVMSAINKIVPGAKITGFDYDDNYMEHARSLGLDLRKGSYYEDTSMSNVDMIYYHHVFEHIYDLENELENAYRALKEDGILVLVVPGMFTIISGRNGDVLDKFQNAHLYYFDLAILMSIVEKQGFKLCYGTEGIFAVFKRTSLKLKPKIPKSDSLAKIPLHLRHNQRLLYLQAAEIIHDMQLDKQVKILLNYLFKNALILKNSEINLKKKLDSVYPKYSDYSEEAVSLFDEISSNLMKKL